MKLLFLTLAVMGVSLYLLFKLYQVLFNAFLKSMSWKIEDLKNYEVPPLLKKLDPVIEVVIIVIIFMVMT